MDTRPSSRRLLVIILGTFMTNASGSTLAAAPAPASPPDREGTPPPRPRQDVSTLLSIARELARDERSPDMEKFLKRYSREFAAEMFVEDTKHMLDDDAPADFEAHVKMVWSSWLSSVANPPGAAMGDDVRPPSPAMAPGAAPGGGVPGSAATPTARTLSSLPPPPSGAPGATTKGPAEGAAPNPPPLATGAGGTTGTGDATGAKSGELASGMLAAALAADIAKLPPEQAAALKPMLDALVASETARQLNFASWDTYRVAQWKKVFDQSVALSWFIFVAVHIIVGVALLVSIGEFFRSGRIARTKSRERAQRRADMAIGLQRIAALAPEAQSAAAAKAVALAEDTAKQDTDLEVSANKLVLRTSVMGFVLMAFALAFYALFIIFVYPVQQGGKTLDARTAPATSPFVAP